MKKRLFPTILVLLAIQANSQKMTVKDSDNNVLMEVNDEGTVGSIVLDPTPGEVYLVQNRRKNDKK